MSLRNEDRNDEELQFLEHPSLDIAFVNSVDAEFIDPAVVAAMGTGTVRARLSLPEIRVRSRVALVYEADNPNDQFDLTSIHNEVTGYACIKTRSMITPVGEIWGKNAVPLVFPKSRIAGIKLETQEDCPWIDIIATLGAPTAKGRWSIYYHATADNKLKFREWDLYSKQMTAEIIGSPLQLYYPVYPAPTSQPSMSINTIGTIRLGKI
jgi:hypothetical protein